VDTHTKGTWDWFIARMCMDSLSCDYRTVLAKMWDTHSCGSRHAGHDNVDTHTKAHGSFSLLLDDVMDEFYDNYDPDCLSTLYPRVG
jgi:hypothetical protein